MSTEDCSYSETRNNRMKKSIEKITYCFVIIAALFVSFVSFVEPLVMKDINITKVILVLLCYADVYKRQDWKQTVKYRCQMNCSILSLRRDKDEMSKL